MDSVNHVLSTMREKGKNHGANEAPIQQIAYRNDHLNLGISRGVRFM